MTVAVEQFGTAMGNHLVYAVAVVIPVIGAEFPLDAIAGRVSCKRFFVCSGILVRFSQREGQVILVFTVFRQRCEPVLHGLQLIVGKTKSLQVGETPVGLASVWFRLDRADVNVRRFVAFTTIAK